MNKHIQTAFLYILSSAMLFVTSCKKDYDDPSGPSSSEAFSSPNALTDVAVGLQNYYTKDRISLVYNTITTSGILTKELYVVNKGNTDEAQFDAGGGSVTNTNSMVTSTWAYSNKIIFDANNILKNTTAVVTDKSYASGLVAYTSIFKALATADMAMFWDNIPDGISQIGSDQNVGFISSKQGYQKAVAILDSAITVVAATPISSSFIANTPKSVDIVNTLYALKARYSLLAEDYPTALAAANLVDRTKMSTFGYNSLSTNPIFTLATSTNNIFQPVDSAMGLPVGLQPDAGDMREPFYIAISANPRYRIKGFFTTTTAPIPVYLPGEIMLIKAEAYTRANDLVNGKAWLDSVLLKTPAKDPFGVGAGLPASTATTQQDLLNQIYKNRCIEMFMSGQKLADMRRFNRPDSEKKRNYLPYPFVERNGNPNTPPDPAF